MDFVVLQEGTDVGTVMWTYICMIHLRLDFRPHVDMKLQCNRPGVQSAIQMLSNGLFRVSMSSAINGGGLLPKACHVASKYTMGSIGCYVLSNDSSKQVPNITTLLQLDANA